MTDACLRVALLACALLPCAASAATNGVYHPYVNQAEREVEYGIVWRDVGGRDVSLQRASVGYAWSDDIATEFYLLSEGPAHDAERARAYELEVRWQLTEQGEYTSDWGLVFEAEVGADGDRHEIATGVLWERQFGRRWVATANALLEYEFGVDVENEFETAFRGQMRYLQCPSFEPAIELYLDDQDYALGPTVLGMLRLSAGRKIRWEAGLLFGLDRETPDTTLRAGIEVEF